MITDDANSGYSSLLVLYRHLNAENEKQRGSSQPVYSVLDRNWTGYYHNIL